MAFFKYSHFFLLNYLAVYYGSEWGQHKHFIFFFFLHAFCLYIQTLFSIEFRKKILNFTLFSITCLTFSLKDTLIPKDLIPFNLTSRVLPCRFTYKRYF